MKLNRFRAKLRNYRPMSALLTSAFVATSLLAQQAAPAPSTAAKTPTPEEETVVLSPFIVEAESGWNPTQTLAGSRFKTEYKDVATQLETFTMDFMDSFNLTSPEEAAIYSLNTENSSEYVSGNGLSQQGDITGSLRVRGLAKGTVSREFFETRTPSDNYNLDRVDIASGPNSILFGTGSPAGVINSTLTRPSLTKDKAMLGFQIDTWGSTRYELNVNKMIIKDKLGIIFAAVRNNREWEKSPSHELSKRYYGGFTVKPFKKTSITLLYENNDIDSHRPNAAYPADRITPWETASTYAYTANGLPINYPSHYLFPNSQEWIQGKDLNGDGKVDGHLNEPIPASGSFAPRSFATTGTTAAPTAVNLFNIDGDARRIITNGFTGNQIVSNPSSVVPRKAQDIGAFALGPTDDYTLTDSTYFPVDANTFNNINYNTNKSEIYNLFINQTITNDWFFEFAMQKEKFKRSSYEGGSFLEATMINVDPNMYLSDGVTPNPHAGQYYFDGFPQYSREKYEGNDWRATMSYEFDFAKKMHGFWSNFGRHRMALLSSMHETKSRNQEFQYRLAPKVNSAGQYYDAAINYYTTFAVTNPLTFNQVGQSQWLFNNRDIRTRYYYDVASGDVIPDVPFDMGSVWSFKDAKGETWTINPENFITATDGTRLTSGRSGPKYSARKTTTGQFSYQGFFWKDRIVATYGYRKDTIKKVDERAAGTIPAYSVINAQTGATVSSTQATGAAPLHSWGLWRHMDDIVPQAYDPAFTVSGITRTTGVVVHPFKDFIHLPWDSSISFGYNHSDTFQPDQAELGVNGANLKGNQGLGTDKFVRLELFDGKFSMRYNKFDNTASPNSAGLPFRRFRFQFQGLLNALQNGLSPNLWVSDPLWPSKLYEGSVIATAYPGGASSNFADPYAIQSDTHAYGDEITLSWKITRDWNLKFTYNRQEVVESNIAKDWIQFAQDMVAYMDTKRFSENFTGAPNGGDMNNDGDNADTFTWDEIPAYSGTGVNNQWNLGPLLNGGIRRWGTTGGVANFTGNSMRTQYLADINSNGIAPIPVLQAYDGRPNDFVRQNRWNVNTEYKFSQGRLKGFTLRSAYRYREAPVVGFKAKLIGTNIVPDLSTTKSGKTDQFVDFGFGYNFKSAWLGGRTCKLNVMCYNVLDKGTRVVSAATTDGRELSVNAGDGRRVNFSMEVNF